FRSPAYIPLEDYFRDRRDLFHGSLYLTDEAMKDLQISRIDLLLRDKDSGEKLIRYADEIGLDMTRYEIAVNDKKFKTVDDGLSAICRIAVTVLVSVCLTAVAVLILLSVFYHVAKQKEKHVLHALGMPEVKVAGIIACEILTLVIVAFSVGGIVGRCSSDALISYVDDNILSSYEQKTQDGEAFTETPLSAPINLTLRESQIPTVSIPYLSLGKYNPGDLELCRREVLYINEKMVNVLGVESADIGGFANRASYSQEILSELRNRTITFKCYVPSTSNYKVNDRIKIFVQDPSGGIQLGETRLVYTKQEDGTWLIDQVEDLRYYRPTDEVGVMKESFIVVGYFDPSDYPEGTDIVMALEELELMYQYCTVTSEKYRGNRYEFWEDVCLKSNR
ncbi:MAG: hypothetical protein J6L96_07545, partial [Clostridia bacterium]|nr:hypothetical protein [Clostridia bacterium]